MPEVQRGEEPLTKRTTQKAASGLTTYPAWYTLGRRERDKRETREREGTTMKRAVGYIRVSTDRQELGPEVQRAAIVAWAAANGYHVEDWHQDLATSGATPVEARPGLLAALESLTPGDALVIHKRDRLARDVVQAALAERLAERAGASILTTEGDGAAAPGDPSAWLQRTLKDAWAQYERLVIGTRTRQALAVKRARGEAVSHPPIGYDVVDGRLVESAAEQEALALVRDLRARGLSIRAIRDELEARGIPPRGMKWHVATVHAMVRRIEAA